MKDAHKQRDSIFVSIRELISYNLSCGSVEYLIKNFLSFPPNMQAEMDLTWAGEYYLYLLAVLGFDDFN